MMAYYYEKNCKGQMRGRGQIQQPGVLQRKRKIFKKNKKPQKTNSYLNVGQAAATRKQRESQQIYMEKDWGKKNNYLYY